MGTGWMEALRQLASSPKETKYFVRKKGGGASTGSYDSRNSIVCMYLPMAGTSV